LALGPAMAPGLAWASGTARGSGWTADVGLNPDVERVGGPGRGGAIARRPEASGGAEPDMAHGLGSSPDMAGAGVMGVGPVTNAEA
jgi:hypothetical protein